MMSCKKREGIVELEKEKKEEKKERDGRGGGESLQAACLYEKPFTWSRRVMCLEPDTCQVSNKSIDFDFSKE